eukprot:scaffold137952_cov36-Attheya_sp.AAC.2
MEGEVFGAFTSYPWRPHGHAYYGSGEAFVWRLTQSRSTPCGVMKKSRYSMRHSRLICIVNNSPGRRR